jgi:predicted dinucleotide-binding enzyme
MNAVERWLGAFEPIDSASLTSQQARQVAAFVDRYARDITTIVEFRSDAERELIVLDFVTGAPQAPVYPIRTTERIALLFAGEGRLPFVFMLREDFPDTEHQQIVPENWPKVICIDDRPWAEARLTWTPAELLERILSWFKRAARGELQDARQPLDPILMGSFLSFIISRSVLDAPDATDLVGQHVSGLDTVLRVKRLSEVPNITPGMEPVTVFTYRAPPEKMKRLRYAPTDFSGLAEMLEERGIDLLGDLGKRLTEAFAEGGRAAWRLNGRIAVIVEMPIVSPRGDQQPGTDMRAFITPQSAGDVGVALGVALKQESRSEGSRIGYVKAIGTAAPEPAALAAIPVQSAEVHLEFARDLAARLAGHDAPDTRRAVLVGAGAIGSHIADCLAREGRFEWTVIDDDRLLPHNLARHIARNADVTGPKAEIVANHVNGIIAGDAIARPIVANVLAPEPAADAVAEALANADIVIDCTASVVAARALSDHDSGARRVSAFFNPSGEAAVVLAEPQDRSTTLRDLEAQYLGLILRTPRLGDHLGKLAETIAYTGACRAITNRIPQSRAAILSGLAANGLSAAADSPEGAISVWTLSANGEVARDTAALERVWRYTAHGWTLAIDDGLIRRIRAMRNARLPVETGGVLFGLVDIPAKRMHLVDAAPAPPDSIEKVGEFVRGVVGVEEMMEDVQRRTAGQIRYVGEWHSHPPRFSARPSTVDGRQLDWLAALMGMDAMPALMVIAADRETSMIFANERAEPMPGQHAA